MTMSHLYRMYILYMAGIFDFTGTQMVLTMKLTSFAYNLYDGTYDYNKVFPEKPHEDKKKAKIYEARRKFAITKLPNPLEFFGYVYCFTCILAGPAFEYQDYTRSIDGDTFKIKKSDDPKLLNKSVGKPSTLLQGLRRLLVGVVCMVLHLQVAAHYKVSALYNKEFIAANGFLQRIFHVCAALLADRFKYYFAWKVAEGASILGGFGFEGYDKDGQQLGWRGVENVDILGFELSPNVQMLSRSWNKRTQGWLERYTYQRTGNSLVATYFVSAIWHGLYPGFFLFFMTLPLMTNVERLVRAKLNPYIVPGFDGRDMSTYPKGIVGQAYWVVSWFFTMTTMNYIVQPFSMGSLENSMTCLGSYYYIPHIGLLLTYVLLEVMPKPKSSDKKKSN